MYQARAYFRNSGCSIGLLNNSEGRGRLVIWVDHVVFNPTQTVQTHRQAADVNDESTTAAGRVGAHYYGLAVAEPRAGPSGEVGWIRPVSRRRWGRRWPEPHDAASYSGDQLFAFPAQQHMRMLLLDHRFQAAARPLLSSHLIESVNRQ